MTPTRILAALAALSLAVGACGDEGSHDRLSVFAAASLTSVLTEVADKFAAANPGVVVDINFAGSPTLREQLREGAKADVVMTANEAVMADLIAEGLVGAASVAAANEMVVAVPEGNPGAVFRLVDLANESLLIGLCDVQVPCGAKARDILKAAGVDVQPDTNETDVRSLLTKVATGELDAGIVYASDVVGSTPPVGHFSIDQTLYEPNLYPIAVASESGNVLLAQLFVDYVLSEAGQEEFAKYGFQSMAVTDS